MQSTTQTTNLLYLLLLLFGVTNLQFYTCAPSEEIPERFFYDNNYDYNKNNNNNQRSRLNNRSKHEAGAYATSNEESDTKLRLLAESRTDPIPLELYQEMNNVTDIKDFIERFVDEDSIDPQLGIREKISNNVERAAENKQKAAECTTDNAVVELVPLNPSTEPDILYYPKCTRVKRCSGCCSSHLLSCQPIEEEVIDFIVTKYRYGGIGNKKMRFVGQEHVLVKEHKKCRCDCRIKEEDCNSYQVYEASQCMCICTNSDSREKCLAQEDKLWDYQSCKCRCRDTQHCTTGTVFDERQCKCIEPVAIGPDGLATKNTALLDRKRFIVKAIPIEPNNSTIYDTES